jgi:hypothetical protein
MSGRKGSDNKGKGPKNKDGQRGGSEANPGYHFRDSKSSGMFHVKNDKEHSIGLSIDGEAGLKLTPEYNEMIGELRVCSTEVNVYDVDGESINMSTHVNAGSVEVDASEFSAGNTDRTLLSLVHEDEGSYLLQIIGAVMYDNDVYHPILATRFITYKNSNISISKVDEREVRSSSFTEPRDGSLYNLKFRMSERSFTYNLRVIIQPLTAMPTVDWPEDPITEEDASGEGSEDASDLTASDDDYSESDRKGKGSSKRR